MLIKDRHGRCSFFFTPASQGSIAIKSSPKKSYFHHLLAMYLWKLEFTSLTLNFPYLQKDMNVMNHTYRVTVVRIRWDHGCKVLGLVLISEHYCYCYHFFIKIWLLQRSLNILKMDVNYKFRILYFTFIINCLRYYVH